MPLCTQAKFTQTAFDYLIIGGGTTGLTLAARLSEDPNIVVGVLEAGDDHIDSRDIQEPVRAMRNIANPKYDWTFFSTPQKHANNRNIIQPRGKGLGGSSLLNFLVSARASKTDLDALATLGNEEWNWESLLPYTKKSESLVPLVDDALTQSYSLPDPKIHGIDGPIKKCYPVWCDPFHFSIIKSFEALGIPWNREPGSGINVGSSTNLTTVDPESATRSYAATGYYAPSVNRPNFLVITGAAVSKVVFENAEDGLKRAVGVDFVHEGNLLTIRGVRKEVILCAGAIQTPALLELSGIGNSQILEKQGIPRLIDLPGVGENLRKSLRDLGMESSVLKVNEEDHILVWYVYEVDPKLETLEVLLDPVTFEAQTELYKEQKGIIASSIVHTFTYLPATAFVSPEQIKEWQSSTGEFTSAGQKKQEDLIRSWLSDPQQAAAEVIALPGHFMWQPRPGKRYLSFAVGITHPLSRGSVHIVSPNPADSPAIDPNYFGSPVDLELAVNALKFVGKMVETEPLKKDIIEHALPGKDATDEELREYVRDTVGSSFHPLGTASMLPREDGGVVDPKLKVYGTSNLRVVDCSILPMEISAHLQATAYALAEKAADIIKNA